MVPSEFGEPSPQSMTAEKSAGEDVVVSASVKLAARVNGTPVFGDAGVKVTVPAVSLASAITANDVPVTVIGVTTPVSVTDTTTWYVPSSGSVMAGALTVYCAALPFWVMVMPGTGSEKPLGPVMATVAE